MAFYTTYHYGHMAQSKPACCHVRKQPVPGSEMNRMNRITLLCMLFWGAFFISGQVCAAPPLPTRIAGELLIDGIKIDLQANRDHIIIAASALNSTSDNTNELLFYTATIADSGWYIIDLPLYEPVLNPCGVRPGELFTLRVYNNQQEWVVEAPASGQFLAGAHGTATQIDIHAKEPLPPPVIQGLHNATAPTPLKIWSWNADRNCTYRYAIDQNPLWEPRGEFNATCTASFSGDSGHWYLHVQARDEAGNVSEVVSVYALFKDEGSVADELAGDAGEGVSDAGDDSPETNSYADDVGVTFDQTVVSQDTSLSPGNILWSFSTEGYELIVPPAIAPDGSIYLASRDDGRIYALAENGTQKWCFETGSRILSSPSISPDGTIYVGTNIGRLHALHPDGRTVWDFDTGGSISTTVSISRSKDIYVATDNSALYAMYPNGTIKWAQEDIACIPFTSPVIASDGTIYVCHDDTRISCFTPDGMIHWSCSLDTTITSSPALSNDGSIFIVTSVGKLYAIDPAGVIMWAFSCPEALVASVVQALDDTIFVGSTDNHLYALQPDGSIKWIFETSNDIVSTPALSANGTVYVTSRDGFLYALDCEGHEKWSFQTAGKIDCSPVLSPSGVVYIGTADGILYAIEGDGSGSIDKSWSLIHHDAAHTGSMNHEDEPPPFSVSSGFMLPETTFSDVIHDLPDDVIWIKIFDERQKEYYTRDAIECEGDWVSRDSLSAMCLPYVENAFYIKTWGPNCGQSEWQDFRISVSSQNAIVRISDRTLYNGTMVNYADIIDTSGLSDDSWIKVYHAGKAYYVGGDTFIRPIDLKDHNLVVDTPGSIHIWFDIYIYNCGRNGWEDITIEVKQQ